MPSLYLQDIDPDEFRRAIVSDVMRQLGSLLHESSEPRLVDGDRLAELLGVSRCSVDRLRADGKIPSVMIGRRRLYRPDAAIAALETRDEKREATKNG
ncbi:helix-turn-helix domain-containing protein [Novipirellula artificiosorum]|uniref:Helix-turn-helix domain protein n=1 Tax=Novipirellula artificiosorum TaxID=2528016 RepID=A0A5C6DFI2_9BACT|nr:helix-turn-helix domain-containing protein [Novipirellula artificiosorum]TWU33886.1 Helix-turn-helix domain protein [Novipirellula artificiosorum]